MKPSTPRSGGHAHLRSDAPHRRGVRSAVVERAQRGVEDLVLGQGPRWLGLAGLAFSAAYLLNQGDILATAVPGFPVWDLAGLIGSTGWGLWVAALGVTLLVRPTAT